MNFQKYFIFLFFNLHELYIKKVVLFGKEIAEMSMNSIIIMEFLKILYVI
jgi:hypothetical protein